MFLIRYIQAFFFAQQSARGFGLMRAAWAAVVLLFMLFQMLDIVTFYSSAGIFPLNLEPSVLRSSNLYGIFFLIDSPQAVIGIYVAFIALLIAMLLGIFPRITTILSVLLLFSFNERNPYILGGGDTLLRNIGFILMIAPNISAFSLFPRSQVSDHRSPKMSIWPYRLLLWQVIVMYGTSFWYKLLGTLWLSGTAVDTALHHPLFTRWPQWVTTGLTPVTPLIDWGSLFWEGLWILLLVPRFVTDLFPASWQRLRLKRILMLCGIIFHGAIFILMDAGSFSLAVFVAYCGLLQEGDIQWLRSVWYKVKGLKRAK